MKKLRLKLTLIGLTLLLLNISTPIVSVKADDVLTFTGGNNAYTGGSGRMSLSNTPGWGITYNTNLTSGVSRVLGAKVTPFIIDDNSFINSLKTLSAEEKRTKIKNYLRDAEYGNSTVKQAYKLRIGTSEYSHSFYVYDTEARDAFTYIYDYYPFGRNKNAPAWLTRNKNTDNLVFGYSKFPSSGLQINNGSSLYSENILKVTSDGGSGYNYWYYGSSNGDVPQGTKDTLYQLTANYTDSGTDLFNIPSNTIVAYYVEPLYSVDIEENQPSDSSVIPDNDTDTWIGYAATPAMLAVYNDNSGSNGINLLNKGLSTGGHLDKLINLVTTSGASGGNNISELAINVSLSAKNLVYGSSIQEVIEGDKGAYCVVVTPEDIISRDSLPEIPSVPIFSNSNGTLTYLGESATVDKDTWDEITNVLSYGMGLSDSKGLGGLWSAVTSIEAMRNKSSNALDEEGNYISNYLTAYQNVWAQITSYYSNKKITLSSTPSTLTESKRTSTIQPDTVVDLSGYGGPFNVDTALGVVSDTKTNYDYNSATVFKLDGTDSIVDTGVTSKNQLGNEQSSLEISYTDLLRNPYSYSIVLSSSVDITTTDLDISLTPPNIVVFDEATYYKTGTTDSTNPDEQVFWNVTMPQNEWDKITSSINYAYNGKQSNALGLTEVNDSANKYHTLINTLKDAATIVNTYKRDNETAVVDADNSPLETLARINNRLTSIYSFYESQSSRINTVKSDIESLLNDISSIESRAVYRNVVYGAGDANEYSSGTGYRNGSSYYTFKIDDNYCGIEGHFVSRVLSEGYGSAGNLGFDSSHSKLLWNGYFNTKGNITLFNNNLQLNDNQLGDYIQVKESNGKYTNPASDLCSLRWSGWSNHDANTESAIDDLDNDFAGHAVLKNGYDGYNGTIRALFGLNTRTMKYSEGWKSDTHDNVLLEINSELWIKKMGEVYSSYKDELTTEQDYLNNAMTALANAKAELETAVNAYYTAFEKAEKACYESYNAPIISAVSGGSVLNTLEQGSVVSGGYDFSSNDNNYSDWKANKWTRVIPFVKTTGSTTALKFEKKESQFIYASYKSSDNTMKSIFNNSRDASVTSVIQNRANSSGNEATLKYRVVTTGNPTTHMTKNSIVSMATNGGTPCATTLSWSQVMQQPYSYGIIINSYGHKNSSYDIHEWQTSSTFKKTGLDDGSLWGSHISTTSLTIESSTPSIQISSFIPSPNELTWTIAKNPDKTPSLITTTSLDRSNVSINGTDYDYYTPTGDYVKDTIKYTINTIYSGITSTSTPFDAIIRHKNFKSTSADAEISGTSTINYSYDEGTSMTIWNDANRIEFLTRTPMYTTSGDALTNSSSVKPVNGGTLNHLTEGFRLTWAVNDPDDTKKTLTSQYKINLNYSAVTQIESTFSTDKTDTDNSDGIPVLKAGQTFKGNVKNNKLIIDAYCNVRNDDNYVLSDTGNYSTASEFEDFMNDLVSALASCPRSVNSTIPEANFTIDSGNGFSAVDSGNWRFSYNSNNSDNDTHAGSTVSSINSTGSSGSIVSNLAYTNDALNCNYSGLGVYGIITGNETHEYGNTTNGLFNDAFNPLLQRGLGENNWYYEYSDAISVVHYHAVIDYDDYSFECTLNKYASDNDSATDVLLSSDNLSVFDSFCGYNTVHGASANLIAPGIDISGIAGFADANGNQLFSFNSNSVNKILGKQTPIHIRGNVYDNT